MPRHRFPDTRDRIESAAIQLFVDKGVTETSVRDIARRVQLSEGALYRHFESKDELVWQLFERHYLAFADELRQLADREATARDKVAAMIRGFCRAHDSSPALFRFLLFVQHGQLQKLPETAVTPVKVVRHVMAEAIARGELPDQSPDLASSFVFGIVLEPVSFAAYGSLPRQLEPLCPRLIAAAWAAITTLPTES
jgi:AcrR family transcriptional regulator